MRLPAIGDTVTTEWALELCNDFGLDYPARRIEADPERYRSWTFDGCSCLPDRLLGYLTGCDWRDITYQCALPHDLCYAYGEKGNRSEREQVDLKFYNDLVIRAGMKTWMARLFWFGVRLGGAEALGLSFSWGFAGR
jgi:hypothetical protein